MKRFRIHWIGNSSTQDISGYNIADAFEKAGYTIDSLKLIDYYEEV